MSTTLFLVRHAAHADVGRYLTGRASGVPLSNVGERQANAVGKRLARERLDAIHTSPRLRARATADAIATHTGAPVRVIEALDEIDFGDWSGLSFADLSDNPFWREWNEARGSGCPPNGEAMQAAAARIAAHTTEIAKTRPGARIALVSHCDMIRALVAGYLGLHLDNLLRFEIAPASISRLEVGPWGGHLISLNEIPDLEEPRAQ